RSVSRRQEAVGSRQEALTLFTRTAGVSPAMSAKREKILVATNYGERQMLVCAFECSSLKGMAF
ncbi:MAG: hypothetical protein ACREBG_03390, partial [Pyrinomonadaceae bacterium]